MHNFSPNYSLRYCICAIDPFAQAHLRDKSASVRTSLPETLVNDIRDVDKLAKRITLYMFNTVRAFNLALN